MTAHQHHGHAHAQPDAGRNGNGHSQVSQQQQQQQVTGVAAAVFYGVCSGSMSFINKVVLTTFDFDFPCFIMLSQMIFTTVLLTFLSTISKISLPAVSLSNLKICRFPSIFGLFHTVLSLHALSGMNIAMYTVLKRCVPLINLLLTPFLMKKGAPSWSVCGSVLLMTAGCIFAGMGDLTFDLNAYTFGIMSVFAQALYLTTVQSVSLQHNAFSAVDIMYLNGINCMLPLLFCTALSSEFTLVLEFPYLFSPRFLLIYLIVIAMGCVLNYAIFLCTIMTSALTTSVVGVVKSIVVVIVGLFTFGGVPLTVLSVFGIVMNTLGSGWYSYDKYRAKSEDKEDVESLHSTQESNSSLNAGNNHIMNGHSHSGIK